VNNCSTFVHGCPTISSCSCSLRCRLSEKSFCSCFVRTMNMFINNCSLVRLFTASPAWRMTSPGRFLSNLGLNLRAGAVLDSAELVSLSLGRTLVDAHLQSSSPAIAQAGGVAVSGMCMNDAMKETAWIQVKILHRVRPCDICDPSV
jgi:hypothetical protein